MSQGGDDRIRVACACGAHLKVPAHAVGKRAKCPKCGAAVLIEAPRPAPAPAPASGGLLDDLAMQEAAAAAAEGTADRPLVGGGGPLICPACAATLPSGAKLCTACGFNLSTRRKMKVASTKPSTAALAGHAAKAAGTFVLGCVLSVVAAGIGAAVWYGLAMATNREFGIVAWGIGLVTGFAMLLGSREPGILKGIIAAGIALLAIVVAKVFIFVAVISAMVTGATGNVELQRLYVAAHMTEEMLIAEGLDPDEATEEQYDRVFKTAQQRAEQLDKRELDERIARYREQDAAEREEDVAAVPDEAPPPEAVLAEADVETEAWEETDGPSIGEVFFKTMFGFMDIVFILLAIVSAAKVAGNGINVGKE